VEVLAGMFIFRIIATPDMSAGHAQPQMDPGIAGLHAFLTTVRTGRDILDLVLVSAGTEGRSFGVNGHTFS
jgi:NCAIR mutase (PurE)-related protein